MANFSSMIQYNYQILASTRGVYLNTPPCVKENVPVFAHKGPLGLLQSAQTAIKEEEQECQVSWRKKSLEPPHQVMVMWS